MEIMIMEWSLRVRGCRFKSQVVLCRGTLEKTLELLQENIQLYKWTLHLKKKKRKLSLQRWVKRFATNAET